MKCRFLLEANLPLINCENWSHAQGSSETRAHSFEARRGYEAGRQLSIRYGHFPYIWNNTAAMDASFKKFLASAHDQG
jgi:hypothetical protein